VRRRSFLFLSLILAVAARPAAAVAEENPATMSEGVSEAVVLHDSARATSARERMLLALSFSDQANLLETLSAKEIPAPIADWHRVRLALQEGNGKAATKALRRLLKRSHELPPELALLSGELDRFCLQSALQLDQLGLAESAWLHPRAPHDDDPAWTALGARLLLSRGDTSNALLRFEEAWRVASTLQRRERNFAYRALAQLRAGDPCTAIRSWLEYAKGLRSGEEKLWALNFWDAHPRLKAAAKLAGVRDEAADWLARNARREEAFALASGSFEEGTGREARESYLIACEQLYRLRRHEELATLLEEPRPRGLDEEARASLAAYPLGVARRKGASVEIAAGFDSVAARYDGTRRAVEALWEAAWMWELSGESEAAQRDFLRYAREHGDAPFAQAAALRAIYLPFQEGDFKSAEAREQELHSSLGGGEEAAAALWLAERSARARQEEDKAERFAQELSRRFPDSPFLGLPESTPQLREDSELIDLENLFQKQYQAFQLLAHELEVQDLFAPRDPSWQRAALLLRYGYFERGERALLELVQPLRRDPRVQLRACALAWAAGRAERQARSAWWLQVLLKGRSGELDAALEQISFPTPFAATVAQEASARGLSPAALWSLMRRESFYEAQVVSRAGAYGLLQLLPETAQRMAEKLGDPTLEDPLRLLDPRINLRYGSAYFAQLLQECGGDPLQALAAYNAGEGNGRRWKERVGSEAPATEMLLTISYSETRAYVYNVLRFWKVYDRILPLKTE